LLWKFEGYQQQDSRFVLLLDEPDSHLHPTCIRQLKESIKNLVNKMNIQVIMTTHNPITLNLLKNEYLYVMDYDENNDDIITIKKASESKIHPSTLLTNDLISIYEPYYQIYVQSDTDKKFYKKLNDQSNLTKDRSIVFTQVDSESISKSTSDQNLKYEILHVLNLLLSNKTISKEINFIRNHVINRMGFTNCSSETKIIDTLEIIEKTPKLNFIYGLLDRKDSFKTYGAKKRIIYPERYDVGSYIFDPYHFYVFMSKKMPDSKLIIQLNCLDQNSDDWYQSILNEFTNAIKGQMNEKELKNISLDKKQVRFINKSNSESIICLNYECFILSMESQLLMNYMLNALIQSTDESSESIIKFIKVYNKP
jgi:hypothetical protein